MKKKLVAFAVTAAMVITSAVPVFAATPDFQEKDSWVNGNIINIPAGETPVSDDMAKDFDTDGGAATFDMVVDLNSKTGTDGQGFIVAPAFTKADDTAVTGTPYLKVAYSNGTKDYGIRMMSNTTTEVGDTFVRAKGIVKLDWEITKDQVKVTVTDYSDKDGALQTTTIKVNLDAKAGIARLASVKLADVNGNPLSQALRLYTNRPADLSAVEMSKKVSDTPEKWEVITEDEQLAVGTELKITAVSFGADTVFKGNDISNYVTVQWYADGKAIDTATGLEYTVKAEDKGKQITAEVKGLTDKAGVYGEYNWGEGNDVVALATRFAGANRYETAMAVADGMKTTPTTKFDGVVIANGDDYADALSATAFVKSLNDSAIVPLLLVNSNVEDTVYDYIVKNVKQEKNVYIIGGESVVSDAFADRLDRYYKVERLAGADRFETNLAILRELANTQNAGTLQETSNFTGYNNIMVVSGFGFADALSASVTGQPVIMVGDELTKEQASFLAHVSVGTGGKFYVIGGDKVVSDAIVDEIEEYTVSGHQVCTGVERLYGKDRYETNQAVINEFFSAKSGNNKVVIASGAAFPDGLTGGVFAATRDDGNETALVLVNDLNTYRAKTYINSVKAANGNAADLYVVGGTSVVSDITLQKIA